MSEADEVAATTGDAAGVGVAVSAGGVAGPAGLAEADHMTPKTKKAATAPRVTTPAARGSAIKREKREDMARL
jgi:hypothetical protein